MNFSFPKGLFIMSSSGLPLSDIRYWRELKILAERASRDMLSGLLNRETATSYIRQYLKHMQPGDSCALFIVDLDNFKQVNDTLGHQSGDQVIRQAARALSGCFRATDIVGRLGGDEFFALLAGEFSEDAARAKAHSVCEALQFSMGVSPVIHVTASVGVYIGSGDVLDFETLYAGADAALYEAKAGGRNRFHVGLGAATPRREPESTFVPAPVQFGEMLRHMEEGVALIELGGQANVIYASFTLCRMMGVDEKKLCLPCEFSSFGRIHPDDTAEYERLLREGAAGGCTVEYEHRFSVREGEWRWCRVRAVRHSVSGSGLPVMMVFSTDISAGRKRDDVSGRTASASGSCWNRAVPSCGMWTSPPVPSRCST